MNADDARGRRLAAYLETQLPQARALGIVPIDIAEGRVTMRAPWRADLVGDPKTDVIAGGVVTTLLDHAGGLAMISSRMPPTTTATLDLRIDYMRPAGPRRDVIAHAYVYKLTRTIGFVRADAYDDDPDDLIATAQGAFVVNRTPAP